MWATQELINSYVLLCNLLPNHACFCYESENSLEFKQN